ncbi:MAG: radical SAM family heme chaperone HemW [Oscillospiraceae bacterium]|nr:radical SAM family heme chaperone HemW [Oscillospiraceae bacterium]
MNKKFGLYIHIPFCSQKCPYCDFFSKTANDEKICEYTEHLMKSIEYWSRKTDRLVTSVYFGGGTPNMLGEKNLCAVLEKIKACFNISSDAEITTELNPSFSDLLNFENLRKSGFNRLSFGMQSSNNDELKMLGRKHTADEVKSVVINAQNSGFENISLDLMLGIPKQTKSSLAESIKFCKDCNVTHISAYILKIEKNTPFYKKQATLNLPDDDRQAELYLFACEELEKYGYLQYEISNFSKTGYESKHNLTYWECEEYIGIGPSAHSFFDGKRFYYERSFEDFYKNKIVFDCFGGDKEEYIMLNLRLKKGLDLKKYQDKFKEKIPDSTIKKAESFEKMGLLTLEDNSIRLTKEGFLVSNTIISELI